MEAEHKEILDIEKKFWEEMDNPELYKNYLADDGLTVFEPMGFIEKKEAVEMSAKAKPFRDVKMEDIHFRDLAPDCVSLSYHGQGMQEGAKERYFGSISSVYVRRNGRWQIGLAVHQPWNPEEHKAEKE